MTQRHFCRLIFCGLSPPPPSFCVAPPFFFPHLSRPFFSLSLLLPHSPLLKPVLCRPLLALHHRWQQGERVSERGKRERERGKTLLSRSITPSRQRNPSMPLLSSLSTAAILLLAAHCRVWAATPLQGPLRSCPSCRGLHGTGRPAGGALAPGEPCGVYTRSCARGLRCVPPPRELSPLQALLQGRGVCAKQSRTAPTDRPRPTGRSPGCVYECVSSHGGATPCWFSSRTTLP